MIRAARPEPSDDELLSLLVRSGYEALHLPVMKIVYLDAEQTFREALKRLGVQQPSKIVFVSRNSVAALKPVIKSGMLSDRCQCFAVGEATARCLGLLGVAADFPREDMTSEGLLALPQLGGEMPAQDSSGIEEQPLAGDAILIVAGESGRTLLRDQLISRGAKVEICEVYRREQDTTHVPAINQFLRTQKDRVLLVHSGELLHLIDRLVVSELQQLLRKTPIVVPGTRVAKLAEDMGFKRVSVAANAMPASMVSGLQDCC